ncbi:MAG: hypothetical protein ACLFUV_01570 [Methanomassiliicoccales archaeon]
MVMTFLVEPTGNLMLPIFLAVTAGISTAGLLWMKDRSREKPR